MRSTALKNRLLAMLLLCSTGINAEPTGAGGEFTIHNKSAGNIVVVFYTNDGSGWSTNWLAEQLKPNESANAAFDADSGACAQTLQVGWLGTSGGEVLDDPININICEASNVYMTDNEIYYD